MSWLARLVARSAPAVPAAARRTLQPAPAPRTPDPADPELAGERGPASPSAAQSASQAARSRHAPGARDAAARPSASEAPPPIAAMPAYPDAAVPALDASRPVGTHTSDSNAAAAVSVEPARARPAAAEAVLETLLEAGPRAMKPRARRADSPEQSTASSTRGGDGSDLAEHGTRPSGRVDRERFEPAQAASGAPVELARSQSMLEPPPADVPQPSAAVRAPEPSRLSIGRVVIEVAAPTPTPPAHAAALPAKGTSASATPGRGLKPRPSQQRFGLGVS